MIDYPKKHVVDPWNGLVLIIYRGSVFPKGIKQSIPSMLLAAIGKTERAGSVVECERTRLQALARIPPPPSVHRFFNAPNSESSTVSQCWFGFQFALGFLCVFRTQLSYSRYWEGTTLMGR